MNRSHTHIEDTRHTTQLPHNPDQALSFTIEAIESLEDVYKRETESLKNSDTKGFINLQDEKLRRAQVYQDSVKQILRRKHEMKNTSPVLQSKLKDMQEKFSRTSQENLESIKRMQRTVDRLGGTIRRAAKDTAKKNSGLGYSENGRIEGESKQRVSIGVSETA